LTSQGLIGRKFTLKAYAFDKGFIPRQSETNISIEVIEPKLKPPKFKDHVPEVRVKEYSVNRSIPLLVLTAE